MKELLNDPMNIYAAAFIVFCVLAYVFGRKPFVHWLDGEIATISAELNTAHELRAEAEAVLADCKTKQVQAERDAQVIMKMAKQQAEMMRKKADADLEAALERQHQLAAERIQIAENKALKMVREAAVTMGMALARKTLTENLSDADAAKLIEEAINEIPALKKTKGGV
jgi:F0F1-type ATP synthase membrane subunit b/b'